MTIPKKTAEEKVIVYEVYFRCECGRENKTAGVSLDYHLEALRAERARAMEELAVAFEDGEMQCRDASEVAASIRARAAEEAGSYNPDNDPIIQQMARPEPSRLTGAMRDGTRKDEEAGEK